MASSATNHDTDPLKSPSSGKELFPATQWSVISRARGEDDAQMTAALRKLALNYWRPLYLYLRKRGEEHEDAADAVQGFFGFVFSSGFLEHVEREGGKFRSYLLSSLERWRSRERVKAGAQKRGGRVLHVPLEAVEAMQESVALSDEQASPEAAYDRQWAVEMVALAVQGVHAEYQRRGREAWFEQLAAALPGGGELRPYAELAASLESSEGAVKKAVFDLRAAFATRLREEIRATVRSNEDAEEELRYLVTVMSKA